MGALLSRNVVHAGLCMITPEQVGLIQQPPIALLLLDQPEAERQDECTCHAADLRATHVQSRILITDRNGKTHVFAVVTDLLQEMLSFGWLQEMTDGVSCTRLQGTILMVYSKG